MLGAAHESRFGKAARAVKKAVPIGAAAGVLYLATGMPAAALDYPTEPYACDGEDPDPYNPSSHLGVYNMTPDGLDMIIRAVASDPMMPFEVEILWPNGTTAVEVDVDPTGGELQNHSVHIPYGPNGTYNIDIKNGQHCDGFDVQWPQEPIPPIPEFSTGGLFGCGLGALAIFYLLSKRRDS